MPILVLEINWKKILLFLYFERRDFKGTYVLLGRDFKGTYVLLGRDFKGTYVLLGRDFKGTVGSLTR